MSATARAPSSSLLLNGCLLSTPRPPYSALHSSAIIKWNFRGDPETKVLTRRTKDHKLHVLAKSNVSSGQGANKEVIMVDPVEAKRIAAKELEEIKAKEKFKRKRQVEAINGAWAMLGLTAGFVIEGCTGKGILGQLAGYLHVISNFFVR
ncbi:hypothetical protein Ancab_017803 [Ancistrocladus abbreviatus]